MALVLIKEDGTGKSDANAYANAADGDSYFEGHLYATAWTGASAGQKDAALVMASRVIDAEYQFQGRRVNESQAMQWPRSDCPDPDRSGDLASDKVPAAVVKATCELAKELLLVDRTAAPPGEGILEQQNSDYSATVYSKKDVRQIIPDLVQAMLARFGNLVRKGSVARLQRA
jgi:hypothetical protein